MPGWFGNYIKYSYLIIKLLLNASLQQFAAMFYFCSKVSTINTFIRDHHMQKILILSSGNSVRSQMAEGWMKYYSGKHAKVKSAGTKENHGINKLAHHLMMDSVIDIGAQTSDKAEAFFEETFDHVILLDKQANNILPKMQFKSKHEYYLEDPLKYKNDKNKMVQMFIETRNKLDDYCFTFVNENIQNLIPPL